MGSSAKVVVVGAGVVAASVAYHPAHLGWTDACVVDKGPIPKTGGSSSHAPGLVFQTNPSKTGSEPVHRCPGQPGAGPGQANRGGEVVGFTTSAAHGYSTGESIAYAWLRPELAAEGTRLEIAYLDRRYPATVASDPRLDPGMQRMRC